MKLEQSVDKKKKIKVVGDIKTWKTPEVSKQFKDILETERRQFYVNKKGLVLTKNKKR